MGTRDDPAGRFVAVTLSDSDPITGPTAPSLQPAEMCRALFVGVGGDVVAIDANGTAVTFKNVASGTILPIRTVRVNSTNTTATNLVALW